MLEAESKSVGLGMRRYSSPPLKRLSSTDELRLRLSFSLIQPSTEAIRYVASVFY